MALFQGSRVQREESKREQRSGLELQDSGTQDQEIKPWDLGVWHESLCERWRSWHKGIHETSRSLALVGHSVNEQPIHYQNSPLPKKRRAHLDCPLFTSHRLKALAATGRKTAEEAADW